MNFDFLKKVELTTPEVAKTGRTATEKLPSGLKIRVFGSGKIYPSKELADVFALEYTSKDSTEKRKGFDVFSSKDWPMFPADAPEQYIFVTAVDKKLPKVDLFGQVTYDEQGKPKSSVLDQGGGSFGPHLLEMIKDVYDIEIPKGEYRDFEIKLDIRIKSPNDVYWIPKTVARGENKGQVTVVRREYTPVSPLVPVEAVEAAAAKEAKENMEAPESAQEHIPTQEETENNVEDTAQDTQDAPGDVTRMFDAPGQ